MPNRYGENDEPDPDIARIFDYRAIEACELCNEDGYIGGRVCDHVGHRAAAQRGMAMVRHTMGWKKPNG